jgi:hypothetical protein
MTREENQSAIENLTAQLAVQILYMYLDISGL